MKEFIEELKYNQNVNIKKGLENRININYIIKRLERINNRIYDNGCLLIGNIDSVIKELKREIEKDIDMCDINTEELLKDLINLKKQVPSVEIVSIDYGSGMDYSFDYWGSNDRTECE